jgi:hypothetical protein
MDHNQLVRDVVQAAMEYHGRKLWERFTNLDCFAVRVPGQADPLVACVMGDAGEQFGLMLFRGPQAADSLAAITDSDGASDDAVEDMDMLSFSIDAFYELAPELQAFFRKAGIHPRHDERVPNLLAKPPNRQLRQPTDEELTLLLTVLKTVVSADRRKLLTPAGLDDPDGICVVTLSGDAANPTITAKRERLGGLAAPAEPVAAPAVDLADLEVLDATWLVGTPPLPAKIKDDDRSMVLLLVADDASGRILVGRMVFAEDTQEAVDALMGAFRTRQPNGGPGLPRTMVFSNRKLHEAVAPVLEEAGVDCILLPMIPRLQAIAAEFFAHLGGGEGGAPDQAHPDDDHVPAPGDLDGWKQADRRLAERCAEIVQREDRYWAARPVTRYFAKDDFQHFFDEHKDRGVGMAYLSWCVLEYRPTKTSQTQAQKMLAKGLPPAQATLLSALMEAHPSVYRVAGHDPAAGTVELEDVLLGGTATITDRLMAENIEDSMYVVGRAYPAGEFHFLVTAGPPLGMGMGLDAVEFLRASKLEFTPEGLKREAHKFGWLWGWCEEWEANWHPPQLVTTDGEPMVFHTASFSVADAAQARQALLARQDVDHDEHADTFIWNQAAGPGAKQLGGPVHLGQIQFIGDELVLTVHSAKRFATARKWLAELPGVAFLDVKIERPEDLQKDLPLDDRLSKPGEREISPEDAQGLRDYVANQYMKWLDMPLKMMGGKTPRQACKTPAGRDQIATLIRTMPDPVGSVPMRVPREKMLRALGLETGPLPSALAGRSSSPASAGLTNPSPAAPGAKVGRNDPCPCGSGKKYKKCCGQQWEGEGEKK